MRQQNIEPVGSVTIQNEKTGDVMVTTAKIFDAVYQHKGFKLISRDNAEPAKQKTKAGTDKGPVSELGSAAAIAASLGIGDDEAEHAGKVAANAETGVEASPASRTTGEPMAAAKARELSEFADDISGSIGIDTDANPAGSSNAETGVSAGDNADKDVTASKKKGTKSKNENDANSIGEVESSRAAAKRDRGRGNK